MASFTANSGRILSEAGEEAAPFLKETEQLQSIRPQRRRSVLKVAGAAAVFALAGTALWHSGGTHSAAVDSSSHAFLGRAAVAKAAETRGIKEMGEEAKALGESYKRDVADEKAAAAAAETIKKSADQVVSMEETKIGAAKKLVSQVEGMVPKAKTEQESAKTVSAEAAEDEKAAKLLKAQAEEDLASAKNIEKEATGGGADSIKAMAKDQETGANNAKKRAEADIAKAGKKWEQRDSLVNQANETLAVAGKLNETAAAETAKAEDLLADAKKLEGQADNLTDMSADISGALDSTKDAKAKLEGKIETIAKDGKLVNSTKSEEFWLKHANATAGVFNAMIDQDNAVAKAMDEAAEQEKGLLSKLKAQADFEQKTSKDLTKAATDIKKIANGSSGSVEVLQQQAAEEAKGADDKSTEDAMKETEALGDSADELTSAAKNEKAAVADLQKVLDAKAAALKAATDAYSQAKQAAMDKQVQETLAKGQGCCVFSGNPDVCAKTDPTDYCNVAAEHCTGSCSGAKYIIPPGYKLPPLPPIEVKAAENILAKITQGNPALEKGAKDILVKMVSQGA